LATFIGRALNLVGGTFILSTGSSKAYQLMARGANARVQGCQARRDRDLVSADFVQPHHGRERPFASRSLVAAPLRLDRLAALQARQKFVM
jgi:hypothetical protein